MLVSHAQYPRVWINRVTLPILLLLSWAGKIYIPLSTCVPVNFVSQHEFPCRVGLLISLLRLILVLTSLRMDSITVRLYMIYIYRHSFKYTMRNERNNLRRTYTLGREFDPGKRDFSHYRTKNQMPNGRRTIKLLLHQIRLHGRRGKRLAESFSRERLTHAPQKEVDEKYRRTSLLCDPGWYVQRTSCPEWLGRKQHTHIHTQSPYEKKRKRQWFKQNSETPKELHLQIILGKTRGTTTCPLPFGYPFIRTSRHVRAYNCVP